MKRHSKLTSREELSLGEKIAQQHEAQEFNSVEHMLRHDAEHTLVPPNIATRIQQTIGPATPAKPAWWRRLFGS